MHKFTYLFCIICIAQTFAMKDCEVCVKTVRSFGESLDSSVKSDHKKVEQELRKFCKHQKNKEERFCHFIGGLNDSATGILGELSKPLSSGLPVEKICERLKKSDQQICDLRYAQQIDVNAKNDAKKKKTVTSG